MTPVLTRLSVTPSSFSSAALTLLLGTFREIRVNGHSASMGVGSAFGTASSAAGRLAALLHCRSTFRGLGGAVCQWDGVEVDPSNTQNNVNTGTGGYARVLKDYGWSGQATLSAAIATLTTGTFTIATPTIAFPSSFTPPTLGGVAINTPASAFIVRIDNEEMLCTISGTTITTLARGWNKTVPAQHAIGAEVIQLNGAKGAGLNATNEQGGRPYLPWPVSGPVSVRGDVLPFMWWDLNDFFANCTNIFGTITSTGNSITNYAQALRSYIHAYRRAISRARAALILEDENGQLATVDASALTPGSFGYYSSAGTHLAGSGAWTNGSGADLNMIRQCSGNRYTVTNTVGDFVQLAGPADLSQDNVVVFPGVAKNGESAVITFSIDGTTVGSIDTSQVATPTAGRATGYCFRFTKALAAANGIANWENTSHMFRATLTSKTAGTWVLRHDSWEIESGQASPVLIAGGFRPLDTATNGLDGGTGQGFATSVADRTAKIQGDIIPAVKSLIAEFAPYSGLPNSVLYLDVDSVLGATDASLRSGDGLHPNDAGYNLVAYQAYQALINYMLAVRNPTALLLA